MDWELRGYIVPQGGSRTGRARQFLELAGIGIQDAINRVLLNAPYHQKLHTDDYMNHIEDGIEDAWDSNGKQGVEDFLDDMACQLSHERFIP